MIPDIKLLFKMLLTVDPPLTAEIVLRYITLRVSCSSTKEQEVAAVSGEYIKHRCALLLLLSP